MQECDRRAAVLCGLLAAAWIGVLFFFSGQSDTESGALSAGLTQALFGWLIDRGADAARLEFLLRKAAHMGVFAVEGFLLAMALGRARLRRWFVWTLAACALLAVANELHQTLPGGRTCSPVDMLIDTAGALIGALLSAALLHALSSASSRKGNHDDTTGDAI